MSKKHKNSYVTKQLQIPYVALGKKYSNESLSHKIPIDLAWEVRRRRGEGRGDKQINLFGDESTLLNLIAADDM